VPFKIGGGDDAVAISIGLAVLDALIVGRLVHSRRVGS